MKSESITSSAEAKNDVPRKRSKIQRRANPDALVWTVEHTCQLTGLGRSTIFERIKDGSIESRLVNGRRMLIPPSVRRFLGIA